MLATENARPQSMAAALRADLLPSIAVFLVALPLCMGIAIASGVPVAAGLITGIVGGIVVGALAGSPLQVSGPAAGLTVIIYEVVQKFGYESLGVVVLIAGLAQVLAGALRLGQWFRAVSPAVIKGMLAGIGVLILASQFHVMVDDKPKENGLANLLTIPQAIAKGLPLPAASTAEQRATRTGFLKEVAVLHERQMEIQESIAATVPKHPTAPPTVAPQLAAELLASQQQVTSDLRALAARIDTTPIMNTSTGHVEQAAAAALAESEAALAAMQSADVEQWLAVQTRAASSLQSLGGALKSHPWAAKVGMVTIAVLLLWQWLSPKRLKAVPAPLVAIVVATTAAALWSLPVLYVEVPDSLLSAIHVPTLTILEDNPWTGLVCAALVVALIASAETLLCATAVDQMHNGPRTRYDRELVAQGVGNTLCGLLGALPMTGVIVRSAANVQAGGTTRASAMLHGLWLLVFVGLLGFVLRSIPVASLAAVLVYTGYKLLNLKDLKTLKKYGWGEVVIYFATMISIVATDLLTGVLVGIGLSAAKLLLTFSRLETRLTTDPRAKRATLALEGSATFLRLPKLAATLDQVPAGTELHVNFEQLDYIDHACLDLLMSWAKQHEATGGRLVIDWNSLQANFRAQSPPVPQKSVAGAA